MHRTALSRALFCGFAVLALSGCLNRRLADNTKHALTATLEVRAAETHFFVDHGYYGDFSALGPQQAKLISPEVAEGSARGYLFKLKLTSDGYEFTAQPTRLDGGGATSYFCDQTGIIRSMWGKPATKSSPPDSEAPLKDHVGE